MLRRPQDAFDISFASEHPSTRALVPEITLSQTGEERELIDSMLTNNKVHLLYEALPQDQQQQQQQQHEGDDEYEEEEEAQLMDVEETKTVYTLFDYLKKPYLDGMRLEYREVYETFCDRAASLKGAVEQDKAIMEELIDTFLTRMVLNMITQDKVAFKVQDEMIHALEELYDHRERPIIVDRSANGVKESKKKKKEKEPVLDVKNDFAHYDKRNREISERCIAQSQPESDEIEIHFSKAKKRGRHQKIRNEMIINPVEAMAGELIEKRQTLSHAHAQCKANNNANSPNSSNNNSASSSPSGSSTNGGQKVNGIDYYPIFKETLNVFNRCTPKTNNHGFYIQRLIQFIRTLDSQVWPLHGLMSMANNMNYCVRAQKVTMKFDRTVKRFYCCFSGMELRDGETVTCIRIIENDAERLKEWRQNPPVDRKPFEAPEFTRSVGAFYMKEKLCCPSTLFFTTFSDRYKAQFPDCFDGSNAPIIPSPVKKQEPAVTTTNSKKKRKISSVLVETKPKYEEEDQLVSVKQEVVAAVEQPPLKKLKTVTLSNVKSEDACLFDSLLPFATKTRPSMLRVLMLHLVSAVQMHLAKPKGKDARERVVWYAYRGYEEKYKRNYVDEREQIFALLEKMTKKSFQADIKQLAFYSIISSPAFITLQEGEAQIGVADRCVDAILDFVEALVVPERKFADFANDQKTRMMRAICHYTQQRIKKRGLGVANPFIVTTTGGKRDLVEATEKIQSISWLRCCPLLFLIIFSHLAKEDVTGLIRQPNIEAYDYKPLFKVLQLTLK